MMKTQPLLITSSAIFLIKVWIGDISDFSQTIQ